MRSSPKDLSIKARQIIPGDIALYRLNQQRMRARRLSGGGNDPTLSIVGAGKGVGVGGEPSIGVDYANPDRIAITSFAGQNSTAAPVYYSSDRGLNWAQYFSFAQPPGSTGIPNDQVLDYGRNGILYATFLSFETRIYTGGTSNPTSLASWVWDLDGSGNALRSDFNAGADNSDQPWVTVSRDPFTASQDNVYSGYDDFEVNLTRVSVANVASPGTLPIQFTADVSMGVMAGFVNPGLRLTSDRNTGAVYAIHQTSTTNTNTDPKTVSYILNRTTDGGLTWGLNGQANGITLATKTSTQIAPKFGTVNALLGGIDHVAVDPTNSDVYCVYGDRDADGNNRLRIVRLTDNGVGGLTVGTERFVGITGSGDMQAALPSIAVNANGTIGVVYDVYDGLGADDFPQFSTHFARSNDRGVTWNDEVLLTFLSTNKDNGNARQRVLGDYQHLRAVGRGFYGAFTANQAALGGSAAMGPVFFSVDENSAPVISPMSNQNVTVPHDGSPLTNTAAVTLSASVSDADGDTISYEWRDGSNNIVGNSSSVNLNLTAGNYTYTLTVTDGFFASDTESVSVTVNPEPNDPPVLTDIPDLSVVLGETLNYQLLASDPDGDPIAYNVTSPLGASVSPGGMVSWTPTISGVYTLTAIVTDSYGATDTDSATVYVSALAFISQRLSRDADGTVTLKFVVKNPNTTQIAKNVKITLGSLGGIDTNTPLAQYNAQIKPLALRQFTLQFKGVPPGPAELRIFGTCSLGEYMFVGNVIVP